MSTTRGPFSTPASDWASAIAPINNRTDNGKLTYTITVAAADTSYPSEVLAAGVYKVFLSGLPADAVVLLVTATEADAVALDVPTPDADGEAAAAFPGSDVERVTIVSERPCVVVKVIGGTGVLYLVPLA